MKHGDKVKIYQDPFTRTKLIGEAVLIQRQPRLDGGANGATHYSGNVRFKDGRETYASWITVDPVGTYGRERYEQVREELLKEMEAQK